MKIEKEQLDPSRWALTIERPAEEMETELAAELARLQRETDLPGFRKGKAPLALIRQRFGKAAEADVLRKRLFDYYEEAVKESGIPEPVAPPEIDIVQFEAGQPLVFKATVEVEPPVELASYEGLTVVRERVDVGEAEVDKQIERLRERQAIVSEDPSPAGADSLLEVDLQELDKTFLPIVGRKREGVMIDLAKSSPDFRDSLLGIKAAESRRVTLLRPPLSPQEEKQYDYFQVTVKQVKRKELPELNDEFARSLGSDVENVEKLREAVRQSMQREMDSLSYQRMSHLLVHQVINTSRVEPPVKMLQSYLDRLVDNVRKSAQRSPEEPFDEELFRDRTRGRAEWNLKWYLIRKKIAEKEGLTVSEEDIQQEFERMAAASGKKLKAIQALYSEEKRRGQLEDDILERKVLQMLMSKARVIDRTMTYEEFFAKEEEHEHS